MPGNRSGFGGFQPRNDPSERRAFFDLKKEGFTFYQEETPRPPTKSGATWYKPSTQAATVWNGTQWVPFGGGGGSGPPLSNQNPEPTHPSTPSPGTSIEASRSDHIHVGAGGGVTDHDSLSNVTSDQHHPQLHDLNSHTDVNAPAPSAQQVLTYNELNSRWEAADSGGITDHDQLANVTPDQHHDELHSIFTHTDFYGPYGDAQIPVWDTLGGTFAPTDMPMGGFTYTQDTVPISGFLKPKQTWWNTATGKAFIYYEDTDSSQWVEYAPGGGSGGGIESGSSDGVFWMKFPDGTMIQHQRVNVPFDTADLNELDRTFPIPFVGEIPSVTATVNGSGQNWNAWTGSDSLTGFTIFISRVGASGSVDRTTSWQAIGRWY